MRRHLTDDQTVRHMTSFLTTFTLPTLDTPSNVESQTSPINVAPSTDGRYDINQLKGDSLWLHEKTGIDELAALRIVVLEWQARTTTQLLNAPLGSGELQRNHARGDKISQAPSFGPSSAAGDEDASDPASEQLGTRRLRLLQLYLSERQYLSKTVEFVVSRSLFQAAAAGKTPRTSDTGHRYLDGRFGNFDYRFLEPRRYTLQAWEELVCRGSRSSRTEGSKHGAWHFMDARRW